MELEKRRDYYEDEKDQPVSVGKWVLVMLLLMIPFVNFIMMIVWAVSDETNKSLRNFARASWIWLLISLILGGLLAGLIAIVGYGNY